MLLWRCQLLLHGFCVTLAHHISLRHLRTPEGHLTFICRGTKFPRNPNAGKEFLTINALIKRLPPPHPRRCSNSPYKHTARQNILTDDFGFDFWCKWGVQLSGPQDTILLLPHPLSYIAQAEGNFGGLPTRHRWRRGGTPGRVSAAPAEVLLSPRRAAAPPGPLQPPSPPPTTHPPQAGGHQRRPSFASPPLPSPRDDSPPSRLKKEGGRNGGPTCHRRLNSNRAADGPPLASLRPGGGQGGRGSAEFPAGGAKRWDTDMLLSFSLSSSERTFFSPR